MLRHSTAKLRRDAGASIETVSRFLCAANADGRTFTATNDALGRLAQAEVTDGPDDGDRPSIATYDAVGNALTAGQRLGGTTTTTAFTHNRLDQVVAEARPDGSDAKAT